MKPKDPEITHIQIAAIDSITIEALREFERARVLSIAHLESIESEINNLKKQLGQPALPTRQQHNFAFNSDESRYLCVKCGQTKHCKPCDHRSPSMTTTDISYLISLARKNLLKEKHRFIGTMMIEHVFKEIRKQLELRRRGRK